MNLLFYAYFICTVCLFCVNGSSDYDAPSEIKVFHTLDESPEWYENGQIVLVNINTGSAVVTQPSLSDSFIAMLKKAKAKADTLYRLKFVLRTSKGKEVTFYSFLKLNTLLKSGLTSVTAFLDQNGSIIGVKASPHSDARKPNNSTPFSVVLQFKVIEQGPIPDTASYILKLEREREAKERGGTQDNRSFLAKYWMYLVPVVLFAFLSGTTNSEGNPNIGAAVR